MIFVDISGFTKLSERLARLGKIGAEGVTDVIATCFDRLLADAYEYDGSLLKFGGDALLLFYRGDAHVHRAAAAALAMRRTLRDVSRFDTDVGRVRLGMTVGVHTGSFDFFSSAARIASSSSPARSRPSWSPPRPARPRATSSSAPPSRRSWQLRTSGRPANSRQAPN